MLEDIWFTCLRNTFTLLQDGDVLIGSPGPYNWRGASFKNIIRESLTEFPQWYQSPVEDRIDDKDPRPDPATGYYSYLGMQIPHLQHVYLLYDRTGIAYLILYQGTTIYMYL